MMAFVLLAFGAIDFVIRILARHRDVGGDLQHVQLVDVS